MSSKIAPKSRRKSKKTNKRVVLYVPDTFDPIVHLPEELRHLADYARYLLHRINVGRVHLRRGHGLVYLKRDYLVQFIPKKRFTAIRDALVDSDVIYVRKFCIRGEMSFGYRLRYPHNQGFIHHQPTTNKLIQKIQQWRKRESDTLRHPVHRELRRYLKAIKIDEQSALKSVHGSPFQKSAQIAMIKRIVEGDFFSVPDKFGRFHSNLTNLKRTIRPFLRYENSRLCNLDIANSQPMIFCLLLVNLLSTEGKLANLIDYEFSDSSCPYSIEIKESLSLCWERYFSSDFLDSPIDPISPKLKKEEVGGEQALPILRRFELKEERIVNNGNSLRQNNFSCEIDNNFVDQSHLSSLQNQNQEEEVGGEQALPILRRLEIVEERRINSDNKLRQNNFSCEINENLPRDVIEFIRLCEQGILYDNLMQRLNIQPKRRDSFKRLFFTQVFFGENKQKGRVRDLFARDFPTVHKAVNDLKRKDHHQLAYLLQSHESKIMIDIICRKILDELPGTFIATIHDSIMTTPDKADEVRFIMMREFKRFGLNPTIKTEVY